MIFTFLRRKHCGRHPSIKDGSGTLGEGKKEACSLTHTCPRVRGFKAVRGFGRSCAENPCCKIEALAWRYPHAHTYTHILHYPTLPCPTCLLIHTCALPHVHIPTHTPTLMHRPSDEAAHALPRARPSWSMARVADAIDLAARSHQTPTEHVFLRRHPRQRTGSARYLIIWIPWISWIVQLREKKSLAPQNLRRPSGLVSVSRTMGIAGQIHRHFLQGCWMTNAEVRSASYLYYSTAQYRMPASYHTIVVSVSSIIRNPYRMSDLKPVSETGMSRNQEARRVLCPGH